MILADRFGVRSKRRNRMAVVVHVENEIHTTVMLFARCMFPVCSFDRKLAVETLFLFAHSFPRNIRATVCGFSFAYRSVVSIAECPSHSFSR